MADARATGRIGWLPVMLTCQAQALVQDGRHRDAPAVLTEALEIAQETAQPQWVSEANAITAYLAAVAGDEQRCRELADTVLAEPAGHVASAARPWARWALGMLDLGQGRLEAAAVTLLEDGGDDRERGRGHDRRPDPLEGASTNQRLVETTRARTGARRT